MTGQTFVFAKVTKNIDNLKNDSDFELLQINNVFTSNLKKDNNEIQTVLLGEDGQEYVDKVKLKNAANPDKFVYVQAITQPDDPSRSQNEHLIEANPCLIAIGAPHPGQGNAFISYPYF